MPIRWETKAAIARMCARLPYGERLYRIGQRRFGQLRADPRSRLSKQIEMARWLVKYGNGVSGVSCVEVGTGHVPVVPIGFFLAGAEQTITVDLHRRIDWDLTKMMLKWLASHRAEIAKMYGEEIVAKHVFDERFATVTARASDSRQFLPAAGIRYMAPTDAAHTNLAPESVDCHYSVTVLEHVAESDLGAILSEAKRVLRPGGHALHFIDLSDHFQHQDRSISRINFLKYSHAQWQCIAGNQFSYCNRLRASDYSRHFTQCGLRIVHSDIAVVEESMALLHRGFASDSAFRRYDAEDLSTTSLRVLLKKVVD